MELSQNKIYSIGYGNRNIEEFFLVLKKYKIICLIDVRSSPYSKHKPEFEKHQLENYSLKFGIKYLFMGDKLGGRPDDEDNYTTGKVDYDSLAKKENFKVGLHSIIELNDKLSGAVLMCSEIKPENCHRSKLIGRELKKNNIEVLHIDENDAIKTQDEVMNIVTQGLGEYDLFGEKPLTSRKKYR